MYCMYPNDGSLSLFNCIVIAIFLVCKTRRLCKLVSVLHRLCTIQSPVMHSVMQFCNNKSMASDRSTSTNCLQYYCYRYRISRTSIGTKLIVNSTCEYKDYLVIGLIKFDKKINLDINLMRIIRKQRLCIKKDAHFLVIPTAKICIKLQ